jgi:hypothetical protein
MSDFMDKAEKFAASHEEQTDEALERGAQEAEERTGGKYDKQIEEGEQTLDEHIGGDEQDQ